MSLGFHAVIGTQAGRHEVKLVFLHFSDSTRFGLAVLSLVEPSGSQYLLQLDRKFWLGLGGVKK